jgi:hypothetical protein
MRIFFGFIAGFFSAVTLWGMLVIGQVGNKTPDSQWMREAYAYKHSLARKISGPKLLIISGSSALFCINSALLQQAYGLPVVNMGVNAGLSPPYLLEQAKISLKPGDTALLPLEYALYNYNHTINPVMVDYYLSEPNLLKRQALPLQLKIVFSVTPERLIDGYRGLPEGFKVLGLYGVNHMKGNGDQTHSERKLRSPAQEKTLREFPPHQYGKEFSEQNEAWNLLIRFQGWAESHGIRLIFIPPSLMFQESFKTDPVERHFYETLPAMARKKGLTYLGSPMDYMYPKEAYFDTPYHLTAEARDQYTASIIELIRKEFVKSP